MDENVNAAILKEITPDLIEVFPDPKKREEWLNTPNPYLRDQPPKDFINPDYIFKFLEVLEDERVARLYGCYPARKR